MTQKLQIEQRDPRTLRGSAHNARTHSAAQIAQLKGSIERFGFNNPVLITPDGEIIAGHGRTQAAREAGLSSIPCVVLPHLDEAARRAFMLADNRIALNSGWDEDLLRQQLEALEVDFPDLSALGFSATEVDAIFGDYTGQTAVLDSGGASALSQDAEGEEDAVGEETPAASRQGITIPLFLNLPPALMEAWKRYKKDLGESDNLAAFRVLLEGQGGAA